MLSGSHRLRWSSTAEQDLREIWRYYVSMASADVADEMLNQLKDAGRKAAEQPLLRRPRDDIAPGLRSVLVHPYAVFYRVADDAVEVMRVLHQRRDLAAILGRRG
jgi:toxin ParE1/3/4